MDTEWISVEEAGRILGMKRVPMNHLALHGKVRARRAEMSHANGSRPWEFDRASVLERLDRMTIKLPEGEDWVRFPEAVRILGIARESLYTWIEEGYIEAHNFGPPEKRAIFFRRSVIETYKHSPPRKARPVREVEINVPEGRLGWFAGIVDGEGCITIVKGVTKRGHTYWNVRLMVVNREPLAVLQSEFGGRVSHRARLKSDRWAEVDVWNANCGEAAAILRAIRPWLAWKGKQADIAIEFQRHIDSARYDPWNPMPDSVREWRDEQVRRIQELNKRGPRS